MARTNLRSADRRALARLFGSGGSPQATTDELQGLLLQVVFALLMVFIVAYFIFVDDQKKERVEEVMELNRQKLALAREKVAEDRRIRYGLNALMTQGTDGRRTFEPDGFVRDGRLSLAPAAKRAFSSGSRAAHGDYTSSADALAATWRTEVLAEAKLDASALRPDERAWLEKGVAADAEAVRRDVRGVQRALAARLQRQWVEHPERLGASAADAGTLADLLRARSLELVSSETGAPVLP